MKIQAAVAISLCLLGTTVDARSDKNHFLVMKADEVEVTSLGGVGSGLNPLAGKLQQINAQFENGLEGRFPIPEVDSNEDNGETSQEPILNAPIYTESSEVAADGETNVRRAAADFISNMASFAYAAQNSDADSRDLVKSDALNSYEAVSKQVGTLNEDTDVAVVGPGGAIQNFHVDASQDGQYVLNLNATERAAVQIDNNRTLSAVFPQAALMNFTNQAPRSDARIVLTQLDCSAVRAFPGCENVGKWCGMITPVDAEGNALNASTLAANATIYIPQSSTENVYTAKNALYVDTEAGACGTTGVALADDQDKEGYVALKTSHLTTFAIEYDTTVTQVQAGQTDASANDDDENSQSIVSVAFSALAAVAGFIFMF